jgi:hypothetical protein
LEEIVDPGRPPEGRELGNYWPWWWRFFLHRGLAPPSETLLDHLALEGKEVGEELKEN